MSIWDWNGDPKINPPALITTTDGTEINIPVGIPSSRQSITTIVDFSQIFGAFSMKSISIEEREELNILKEEYALQLKMQKIAHFKKIDPAIRQFVINAFTWNSIVQDLNYIVVDKNPRMLELEHKDTHGMGSISGVSTSLDGLWRNLNSCIPMPEGISLEELRAAHIEATLEEEMLNEANT
jgi:hypothetical protein